MGQSVLRDRKALFRNGDLTKQALTALFNRVYTPVLYRKGIRLIFLNREAEIDSPRGSPVR